MQITVTKNCSNLGVWGPLHVGGGGCQVVNELKTQDGGENSTTTSQIDRGFCQCPVCVQYVKLLWQHTVGETKVDPDARGNESHRAPQRCRICGHHLHRGDWRALHVMGGCRVPEAEYSPAPLGRSWRLMCCPCAKCQKHLSQIV